MKPQHVYVPEAERADKLKHWLEKDQGRLGLITSVSGDQLITLTLDPANKSLSCWETPVEKDRYRSLTPFIPQCHWFERTTWDMFGLYPGGHPRLKHNLLHEPYDTAVMPLRNTSHSKKETNERTYTFLKVQGNAIYEIPVGPIHAGIIEPGHFRFSCLGEIITNLEIRLGYVHRGVEKRLTEVPWKKARFAAEAAASDMAAANALAHAIAIESLCGIVPSKRAQILRTISLEIERVAMHISDLGGIAGDIGFLAVSSSMARLRGDALAMGDLLAGSRFQRGFICPGGIARNPVMANFSAIARTAQALVKQLAPVIDIFSDNQVARDRMEKIGRVQPHLARDFGLVGVGGRASGISYDCRHHFPHGVYPGKSKPIVIERGGDVLSRVRVRIGELNASLALIQELIEIIPEAGICERLPDTLDPDSISAGVVESHRGELIHLVFTDENGNIKRYAIKDASVNNWTGLAIAVRNSLVADFPLCNKSFSLSYSGHDL